MSPYEFEAMIVIFMFGRFWHLWRLITARHFRLTFEVLFCLFSFLASVAPHYEAWV